MFVKNKVRKITKSDIWLTPKKTYDVLDKEFHFTLDAATQKDNPLGTEKFYTKQDDSLTKDWSKESVWLNPPFSQCKEFSLKARQEFMKGATVVMLVPARIDANWFKTNVAPFAEIRMVDGRLNFNGLYSAPFATVICVFSHQRKHLFFRKYKSNLKYQTRGY